MSNLNESLQELMNIEGASAVAIVDSSSGMALGTLGSGIDLDIAAAGNTEVMRAKLSTIKALGLKDSIEDILITLSSQYHVMRPLASNPNIFVYLVLDKERANLAMARYKVAACDGQLEL